MLRPARSNPSTPAKRRKTAPKTSSTTKKGVTYRVSLLPNPVDFGRFVFPMRIKNRLRYSSTTELTMSASGGATMVHRANGMFDPEVAIGGHQPMGFDQLTQIYNHYHVVASKYTVRLLATSGIGGAVFATILVDDDQNLDATSESVRERPGAKSWLYTSANTDLATHSITWNAQKTFGGNVIDNDELKGTALTDPPEQSLFWIFMHDGTPTNTFNVFVDVEYTAVWSELKSLQIS